MGNVSYGIYLLQGLVITLVFASDSVRTFALGSPAQHSATVVACSIILLFVSAVTHVGIERVGIDFGKRVYVALESVRKVHSFSKMNVSDRLLLLQSKLLRRWRNGKPPGEIPLKERARLSQLTSAKVKAPRSEPLAF
jgi:hypothetical protein